MTAPKVFVGRDRDVAALAQALVGPPTVVLVEGDAGVGKSRLLAETLALPDVVRRPRLLVTCPPFREPYPLGPLADTIRRYVDDRSKHGHTAGIRALGLSALAGVLRPLFPEWASDLPPAPDPTEVDATEIEPAERFLRFRALAELLDRLAVAIVVIEDLQWVDDATAEFLLFLMTRPTRSASLVLTRRPADPDEDSLVRRLWTRSPATSVRRTLSPLGTEDSARLVSSVLDDDLVSPPLAAFVYEATGGVPLAVEESVRLMRARAELERVDGEWVRQGFSEIPVPSAIHDAVLERLARFDGDALDVLRAAAVLGHGATQRQLAAVAGLSGERTAAGLADGLASRLLAEDGQHRLGFRQVLAARAVHDAVPRPIRQTLHLRAGRLLEQSRPAPVVRLARHFREAGETAAWRRYGEQAADLALAAGDETTASTRLHELIATADLSSAALLRLVHKLPTPLPPGNERYGELLAALRSVPSRDVLTSVEHARVRFEAGRLLSNLEEFAEAGAELRRALDGLPEGSHEALRAMLFLGHPYGAGVTGAEHQGWIDRAVRALPDVPPSQRLTITVDAIDAMLALGDERGWTLAARLPTDTDLPSDKLQLTRAEHNLGEAAMIWGHYAEARRRMTNALELSEKHGYRRVRDVTQVTWARLRWFTGDWDGLGNELRALSARANLPTVSRLSAVLVSGRLHAARGAAALAEQDLRQALSGLRIRGALAYCVEAQAALAVLRLRAGLPDEALELTEEPMHVVTDKGTWHWAADLVPVRVAALVRANLIGDAADALTAFEQGLGDRDAPASRAALVHCRALLAEADADHERAAALFASAARAWQASSRTHDALLARERQGACLVASGEREAGLDLLTDVRVGLIALGARGDAEQVVATLRRHGVAAKRPQRGGRRRQGDQLTPREAEVVGQLVTGQSNREIADALVLSPRTVARHLDAAMRKLRVSTRTALAVSAIQAGIVGEDGGVPAPPA